MMPHGQGMDGEGGDATPPSQPPPADDQPQLPSPSRMLQQAAAQQAAHLQHLQQQQQQQQRMQQGQAAFQLPIADRLLLPHPTPLAPSSARVNPLQHSPQQPPQLPAAQPSGPQGSGIQQPGPAHHPTRVTSTHMSNALCERLIQHCNRNVAVIGDNGNSMDSRSNRRRMWQQICDELNAEFTVEFTSDQYKKKYQNLKTAMKTKLNNKSPEILVNRRESLSSRLERSRSPLSRRASSPSDVKPYPLSAQLLSGEGVALGSGEGLLAGYSTNELLARLGSCAHDVGQFNMGSMVAAQNQHGADLLAQLHHQLMQQAAQVQSNAAATAAGLMLPLTSSSSLLAGQQGSQQQQQQLHLRLSTLASQQALAQQLQQQQQMALQRQDQPVEAMDQGSDQSQQQQQPVFHNGMGLVPASNGSSSSGDVSGRATTAGQEEEEEPTRMFCLSMVGPLSLIRAENPVEYVRIKRAISAIVYDVRTKRAKGEEEASTSSNPPASHNGDHDHEQDEDEEDKAPPPPPPAPQA